MRDETMGRSLGEQSENLAARPWLETRCPCHLTIQRFIFFISEMVWVKWYLSSFQLWYFIIMWLYERRLLRVPWTAERSNQSIWRKSALNSYWKNWCWNWSSNAWAVWQQEPAHWKCPWCWERLKAGGEEGDRGWDGWTASLTQWIWIWANSGI